MTEPNRVYVSFESQMQVLAKRLDTWPWTNEDLDLYDQRTGIEVHSPQAEPIKSYLRPCIEQAEVTLCLIAGATSDDPWIAWELQVSNSGPQPNGLVGVMIHEHHEPPPAMLDRGAVFVPFKRDLVERAVRWVLAEPHSSDDFALRDF